MRRSLLPLVILTILCLAAAAIAADKVPPRTNGGHPGFRTEAVRAYLEGFEGAFPPAGWTQTITNPTYTWIQDFVTPYEGAAAAYIPWQAGVPQNEVLSFSHLIDSAADEDHLIFATQGSMYWATNANLTVEVNGLEVYNFLNEFTAGNWVWDLVDVDLSAYDGQTVAIDFIYAGDDGADHYIDAVALDEGAPPPPPPPANDLCENAIDLQEQGLNMFDVDLCLAANDYSALSGGCTGYSSAGKDVVYKIYLAVGETFSASMQGTHDAALWLVTGCADPTNNCVVGADETVSEGFETITYVAAAAGWYYMIVDGYGTDSCSLTTVTVTAPVGNQNASWSDVKTMYR
jgi:hypothetical protein